MKIDEEYEKFGSLHKQWRPMHVWQETSALNPNLSYTARDKNSESG